jgi:hypothetical protein
MGISKRKKLQKARTTKSAKARRLVRKSNTNVAASSQKRKATRRNGNAHGVIQLVLPLGNGWVVKNNRASTFITITDSRKEAISIARKLAKTKRSELEVHGKSGRILIRESYAQ